MNEPPVLRIGMIGAGFLAATRARCYAQSRGGAARIVAVASQSTERAADFARTFGVARVCESVAELLARPDVQLVDLCVPNRVHRALAEAAFAAGKDVLCTKPLTAYVGQDLEGPAAEAHAGQQDRRHMYRVACAEAAAMVGAARRHQRRLFYGENWVFAPAIVRAQRLLAAAAGTILEMRGWEAHKGSHSPYSRSWHHTGGGALLRLGSHPIGAMLHLKEQEGLRREGRPVSVESVTAEVADLTRTRGFAPPSPLATGWKDVENWGCAILRFEDGSRGIVYGSDNTLGGMESKLEIYSSTSHLKCHLSPHDLLQAYAPADGTFGDEALMEKVDTQAGWSTPLPSEDWSSGQLALCDAVVQSAREGVEFPASGELGHQVVRVLYAAYVAAAEGTRVSLTELDAPR